MDEIKIQELLRAQRPLTPEEQALLEDWYDRFPEYREYTFPSPADKERQKGAMKSAIYESIGQSLPLGRRIQRLPSLVRNMAAAVLILVVITAAWIYRDGLSRESNPVAAILYTEVTAVEGKLQQLVTLPDSSQVWLMGGSTLKYPRAFEEHSRTVELVNGIAFFSVRHNESAPFSVKTSGGLTTTVLGTSFNIKAFRELDGIEVGVVTGKVKVDNSQKALGTLTPDHQIIYSRKSAKGRIQEMPAAMMTSWLKGDMVFRDAGFNEVALILAALYKVKLVYNKETMAALRFNFRFSNRLSLVETLDILKDMSNISYRVEDSVVTVDQ